MKMRVASGGIQFSNPRHFVLWTDALPTELPRMYMCTCTCVCTCMCVYVYMYMYVCCFIDSTILQPDTWNSRSTVPQFPIPILPSSPRHSRNISIVSDFNKSIRSLISFRDIFVDRKRIQFTSKVIEGKIKL